MSDVVEGLNIGRAVQSTRMARHIAGPRRQLRFKSLYQAREPFPGCKA